MANGNNVQNVKFLRNGSVFTPTGVKTAREVALNAMNGQLANLADGSAILGRYQETNGIVKTLVGFAYISGETKTLTVFDVDGAGADVDAKIKAAIEALDAQITSTGGKNVQVKVTEVDGKITAVNITTDKTVNSGDVESAITDAISELDGSVTAENGYYVKSVTEADGKISGTTAALPTVAAISETGKPITAVSESLGAISATAGTINAEFVNIADSGEKFTATTVEGAFAEVAAKIEAMDKDASAVDGQVVTTVSEADGVVSETKANVKDLQLGGYSKNTSATGDIASDDTINAALSKLENKAAAITITNDDKSINVTTGASGTDINVNIKSGEKVIKKDGNKGIYTDIDLVKITTGLPADVKERYQLLASDDSQIGANIDVPKDSHIVSITYITDSGDTHYQNLEYKYINASGETKTEYVDISSLVLEAEFASGITVTNHVAHGVVDSTSEKDSQATPAAFLTVGADGFKVSGIKDEIDRKINALDATVGSTTVATGKHVAVEVVETDGKLTALTVTEGKIADADALAALSAKTVTEITSSNSSISATSSAATDGTIKYDVITDADKIKMSGFSADSASALSGIAETDSIATAFEKTNAVITANEKVTADALTDLDGRLDVVEGEYISGVSVNGNAVTVANKVAPISITSATSAATATGKEAIVVTTNEAGAVTLGIATLDCGTY